MLPVLIGSRALYEYGIVGKYRDIDLVVNKQQAGSLAFESDEKKGLMLWFGCCKVDLHPIWLNEQSNEVLFNKCNENTNPLNCKIVELPMCSALLPPLELLYVIIKSHIHRIIPITPNQDQNIDIWYEHMAQYKAMRDKLGYVRMDDILYDGYLGPWRESSADDASIENLMMILYQMRFRETIARVGDTQISLEKSERDFFDDNVERFVEHDSIHSEVGIVFRDNADPIFKRYQSNPSNVSLDLDIFLKADNCERIDMMREEIMVLLLERKWIPEIIKCYKEMRIPYTHYNIAEKKRELIEIGANFVTNLCGQGDYWLRRYCLDHSHLLLDPELYDYDKLRDLTLKITGYDSRSEAIRETNIFKTIDAYANENFPHIEYFWKCIDANQNNVSSEQHQFFGKENRMMVRFLNIKEISKRYMNRCYINRIDIPYLDLETLVFGEHTNKALLALESYFSNGFNLGCNIKDDRFTIYNLVKNIGIHYDSVHIKIFTLNLLDDLTDSGKKTFQVQGSFIGIANSDVTEFWDAYVRKYKTVYYHSTDCTEQGPFPSDIQFLASYGTAPDFLKPILQLITVNVFFEMRYEYNENYNKISTNLSDEDSLSGSDHQFC